MFEVRQAGVKGFGIFSTSQIARGSRILSERPLLLVDHNEINVLGAAGRLSNTELDTLTNLSVNQAKRSSLWNLLDALFQSVQLPFFSSLPAHYNTNLKPGRRSSPRLPGRQVLANIQQKRDVLACFYNNNFALSCSQHNGGTTSRGVFPTIARLNHSCIPNAQGNFNSNVAEGSFTIHALRDIAIGEEITLSYLHDELASQNERQQLLHQMYGFFCACEICSNGQRVLDSNKRRQRLRDELAKALTPIETNEQQPLIVSDSSLGLDISSVLPSNSPSNPDVGEPVARGETTNIDLSTSQRLIKLTIETYEQEGLVGGELASLYGVAAGLADLAGDQAEALRLGARSMELERDATGEDSPAYQMRRRSFECMEFEVAKSPLLRVAGAGAGVPTALSSEDEIALSYAPWT